MQRQALTRDGISKTGARDVTIINIPATPVITSSATAAATQNKAFTYKIIAIHEAESFSATGLPAGLEVNTETGVISGNPAELDRLKDSALEIMQALRGWTSGLGVPQFVIDSPGGGGKVPLLPEYVEQILPRPLKGV